MIGASVLYQSLSKNYQLDSLYVESTNNESKDTNQESDSSTQEVSNHSENTSDDSSENTSSDNSVNTNDTSTNNSSNSSDDTLFQAPDFTVYDLEGNEVHLKDFFGKPIIVNFWASWCGPCKMEMPDFHTAYLDYKDEITFLMVNMTDGSRETVEIASSFINNSDYTFPVYFDTAYNAAITYSVSSLPTTYFLNEKGELIAHAKGAIDANTLQKGIDMIYQNTP
ncbi:MAG: TlpA family protein disulfide reductase [Lachnospiraceae bacterium]|nr:TlpA family protein disulfide reductase [Lachnospiraceae bacterium]